MRVTTPIALDESLLERVKQESQVRRASFEDTLDDLLRLALGKIDELRSRPEFKIRPSNMGYRPDLNNDCVEELIEYSEGPMHR